MATTDDVRSRFPGLSDGWVRFDGPAGTLPVDTCVDAIADYLRSPAPANLGGLFDASIASVAVVDRARAATAELVGASADEIVFGPSTTNLMFSFTRALSRHWQPGDRIVCTQLDHDSNVSPWILAARDVGATVELLEVDPVDGTLDVEPLKGLCADGRTRWVAISGASNLTGHAPDLERATAIAHEYGAKILVDGVARVPHLPTSASALDVDVLSTSPYKWYGPHAVPVWGVVVHEALHFYGDPGAVRSRNLAADPRLVVHLESGSDVLLLQGTALSVSLAGADSEVNASYAAKYTDPSDLPYLPDATLNSASRLYVVTPARAIAWTLGGPDEWDNRRWSSAPA